MAFSERLQAVKKGDFIRVWIGVTKKEPKSYVVEVVDPGWLEHDTDRAKLAHDNSWVQVRLKGKVVNADPYYAENLSILEQIAYAAR